MLSLLAQSTSEPCKGDLGCLLKLNETGTKTVGSTFPTFASFLNLIVPLMFIIAGIILLFLLIGGGFTIIASGGNAKSTEQGKNAITAAIIGFVVIFAAFWIIQIIQVFTGVPILNSTL